MGRAETVPPDYDFHFVMEYPRRVLVTRRQRVYTRGEPGRQTRCIMLEGRERCLVFLTKKANRDRCHKQRWTDRTERFHQEWEQVKRRGGKVVWQRRAEQPEPITKPDRPVEPPTAPESGDPLDLSVKNLRAALATGKLDGRLRELIGRERAKDKPRSGALAVLVARAGAITEAAA